MKQHLLKQTIAQPSLVGNSAQQAAITHESGPVMCLAGPGSGKTFVLTQHIRYLIEEKKVDPYHILVITFSKASAIEMQKRFTDLMKQEYYPVRFGTFHSIFFQILNRYEHYKTSDILTLSQKKKYLKTTLLQMNYQGKFDVDSLENILSNISYYKNHNNTVLFGEIEKTIPQFCEIYEKYDRLIRQERKLDFDDMMLLCHRLLQKKPEILDEYRKEIEYVLIDEYQDINTIQYQLVKKLIEPHKNLFVVGDDDQSIYGFRGCDPGIMLNFKKQFPIGKIITFPINYRCSQPIVEAAGRVVARNKNRYPKEVKSIEEINNYEKRDNTCVGEPVHYMGFVSRDEEYGYLLKRLKGMSVSDLNNSVCLFRTNMDASYLAEILLREKISYQMKEKPYNPYEHFISRDFLHYLNLKEGNLYMDEFIPVMNRPLRYISRDAVDYAKSIKREDGSAYELYGDNCMNWKFDMKKMKEFYSKKEYMLHTLEKMEYDLKRMKNMDIFATVNYIRKAVGYDDFLRKYAISKNVAPEEYLKLADDIQMRMGVFDTLEQLEAHIDAYGKNVVAKKTLQSGVCIMTYHASKGLEFETVFMPDCNEGIIPYRKSISAEQIEEERRLFYVAMTRAKKRLHILYLEGEKGNRHLVSRFVREAKGIKGI